MLNRLIHDEILIIRIFFVLIATWLGNQIGNSEGARISYTIAGFVLSVFFVIIEYSTRIISSKKILLASLGLLLGLLVANFLYQIIPESVIKEKDHAKMMCYLFLGYMGVVLAVSNADRFDTSKLKFIVSNAEMDTKILDTSVIIDGRIQELITMGFLTGSIVVPEFVIAEMQRLADSADATKRARGRRGLEILDNVKEMELELTILEKDFKEIPEVDMKLVQLAVTFGGTLLTNDYNLQKVAHVHGVRVMNINELAAALKPATFIGESMKIYITKEGRETSQGVGYLEDGTMVVVEDGRNNIGEEIEVDVTSILQTTAGRMIFAKLHEIPGSRKS